MLRKIRVTLAVVCFTLITLLFLDFTGTLHAWFGWLAKIQFLPAVLALNVGVIVALLALTLLSGRVYCSVICPLGVFQDAISWISGKRKKKKYRFSYSPAVSWLRYGALALFVVAAVAGYRFAGGVARSVQFLRPHRAKPVRSRVSVGKQPAGLSGRKSRQLRFLPDGGVDEKPADFSRGRRYFRDADRAGVA